jgi:ATP-dependent DNA ligase
VLGRESTNANTIDTVLLSIGKACVHLFTRNGHDRTDRYPLSVEAARLIGIAREAFDEAISSWQIP